MRTWLKEIRIKKGISQKEAAKKAGIGQQYYNFIENNKRGKKLPYQTAKKIADALGFKWTKFYEESAS